MTKLLSLMETLFLADTYIILFIYYWIFCTMHFLVLLQCLWISLWGLIKSLYSILTGFYHLGKGVLISFSSTWSDLLILTSILLQIFWHAFTFFSCLWFTVFPSLIFSQKIFSFPFWIICPTRGAACHQKVDVADEILLAVHLCSCNRVDAIAGAPLKHPVCLSYSY